MTDRMASEIQLVCRASGWRRKSILLPDHAASIQNIVKSVNRVGLDIDDVVMEQLAASEAVLSAG